MRKNIVLGMLFILCLSGCDTVRGSNRSVKKSFPLKPFNTVIIDKNYDITIEQGATPKIYITTDDNVVPLILPVIENEVLRIDEKQKFSNKKPIQLRILGPDIKTITYTSSGNIMLKFLNAKELTINNKGSGSIKGLGKVEYLVLNLEGKGDNIFRAMSTKFCELTTTGKGKTEVHATDYLQAFNYGSGQINYFGSPDKVRKENKGNGSINEIKE